MKVFYCSTCFECYYIHPQEMVIVCRCCSVSVCTGVLVHYVQQPAFGYHPTPAEPHQYTSTHQNRTTPKYNHHLLRMNVITFETCWAIKNFHKVKSSWSNLFSAPACIRIPPYTSRTALIHQYTPKQNNTPTYNHHLLRMNVITFETCWAIKNLHKVTSSWSNLFNNCLCILFRKGQVCQNTTVFVSYLLGWQHVLGAVGHPWVTKKYIIRRKYTV